MTSIAGHKRRQPEPAGFAQQLPLHSNCCCAVCFEVLLDPVTLLCGHSLDQRCLQQRVVAGHRACPTCNTPIADKPPAVTLALSNMLERLYPKQLEARRAHAHALAHKQTTEAAKRLETALFHTDAEALRASAVARWRGEQSAAALRVRAERLCEQELARWQLVLSRVRATTDTTELREVGLKAVSRASRDALCAMAVQEAVLDGMDVNTSAERTNERWLWLAARRGLTETVRTLLQAGAAVNHADKHGFTALCIAAQNGYAEVMRTLLQAGADVNHPNTQGRTALFEAAELGHAEEVRTLLEAGADVNQTDHADCTALWVAALNGHLEVTRALLRAEAAVDHANSAGDTALFAAAWRGHAEVMRALLQAGADVNLPNNQGCTALWVLALKGHTEGMRVLLEAGADVNYVENKLGTSVLFAAAASGHVHTTQALLLAGADINHADHRGRTALFAAAMEGCVQVVRSLLEAGADINRADNDDRSPLAVALLHERQAVVQALEGAAASQSNRHLQQPAAAPEAPTAAAADAAAAAAADASEYTARKAAAAAAAAATLKVPGDTGPQQRCTTCKEYGHLAKTCDRRSKEAVITAAAIASRQQAQPTMEAAATAAAAAVVQAVAGDAEASTSSQAVRDNGVAYHRLATLEQRSHASAVGLDHAPRRQCSTCKEYGHLAKTCGRRTAAAAAAAAKPKAPGDAGPRRQCTKCKEYGHLAKTCDRRSKATSATATLDPPPAPGVQAALGGDAETSTSNQAVRDDVMTTLEAVVQQSAERIQPKDAAVTGLPHAPPAAPPTPRKTAEFNERKEQGNSRFRKGDMVGALEAYSRCLQLDGSSAVVLSNRAAVYLKMERYAAAEADASHALVIDPTHLKARHRRGLARRGLGKLELAMADLRTVLQSLDGSTMLTSRQTVQAELDAMHAQLHPAAVQVGIEPGGGETASMGTEQVGTECCDCGGEAILRAGQQPLCNEKGFYHMRMRCHMCQSTKRVETYVQSTKRARLDQEGGGGGGAC